MLEFHFSVNFRFCYSVQYNCNALNTIMAAILFFPSVQAILFFPSVVFEGTPSNINKYIMKNLYTKNCAFIHLVPKILLSHLTRSSCSLDGDSDNKVDNLFSLKPSSSVTLCKHRMHLLTVLSVLKLCRPMLHAKQCLHFVSKLLHLEATVAVMRQSHAPYNAGP